MIDPNEMFATRGPHPGIHCKTCEFNKGKADRGDCEIFEVMKPDKIYFDGEKCMFHFPEENNPPIPIILDGPNEDATRKLKFLVKQLGITDEELEALGDDDI